MFSTSKNSIYVSLSLFNQGVYGCPFHVFSKSLFQLGSLLILVTAPEFDRVFLLLFPNVMESRSLLIVYVFNFYQTLQVVPHGTKGTGPEFVTRPVYLRSQLRNNTNTISTLVLLIHFISCSLYMVCRYHTSPGAPDLWTRLG